jgi:MFS family permease
LAAAACLIYAGLIWADSSSLTAGTVGSADPARRGATMAVHSTLGYFGGFLGPLVLGLVLDLYGEQSPQAWGIAFMHLSVVVLVGLIILRVLKPTDLAGDRARAR